MFAKLPKSKAYCCWKLFVVPTGYLYKAIVWHGNNRFQYLQSRVRDYHRRNKGWSHYSVWLLVQEKGSSFFGYFSRPLIICACAW